MGGCLGYEESYSPFLLAHYDPYNTKDTPYRLECVMAYKEHLIQPKIQTTIGFIYKNRVYVPPIPTTSKTKYYRFPVEEGSE